MSLLPTSSRFDPGLQDGRSSISPMLANLGRFPSQMPDFELSLWQLLNLCIAPRKVYRQVYYHKQTKNTWARDDPAVLLLITAALCFSGLLWGLTYSLGLFGTVRTILVMVVRDFVVLGLISGTALWLIANYLLQAPASIHTTNQRVEWAYALDVHMNGFFPGMVALYYGQLILRPILIRKNWICMLLGNTVYLFAFGQYWYVTYLGYNALPFLQRTELLLFPVLLIFCFYLVSLLGFNCSRHFLSAYFGSI